MKVTLVLTPWHYDRPAEGDEEPNALLRQLGDGLVVDGKAIPHDRYVIEASQDARWLQLRIEGAPLGSFTDEEYLEGSDPENGYYLLFVTGLQVQTPDGAVHSWIEEPLADDRPTLPPEKGDPYTWESGT